jgi:hypothetical protein
MTVSTTANRATYTGNGSTTTFSFPYFLIQFADLLITSLDASGNILTYVLNTDYTLSGTAAANGTYPSGVTATFGTAPASPLIVSLIRVPDNKQATTWVDGDPDPAAVKMLAFDKLTLEVQRCADLLLRTVILQDPYLLANFNPALPVGGYTPGYSLAINSAGTGFIWLPPGAVTGGTILYTPAAGSLYTAVTPTIQGAADMAIPRIFGTLASPVPVLAGTALIPVACAFQIQLLQGSNGSPTPVTVTANPQIAAGTIHGQILQLWGTDSTNTVTYGNGTGLLLNGPRTLILGSVLELGWDGTYWRETYYNQI